MQRVNSKVRATMLEGIMEVKEQLRKERRENVVSSQRFGEGQVLSRPH